MIFCSQAGTTVLGTDSGSKMLLGAVSRIPQVTLTTPVVGLTIVSFDLMVRRSRSAFSPVYVCVIGIIVVVVPT